MPPHVFFRAFALSAVLMMPAAPALAAAACGSGNFQAWLDDFKTEAAAKGIAPAAIASA